MPRSRRAGSIKTRAQEFPGVGHYRDRHGKLRWRYRVKGFTVNLGTEFGSDEFIKRYTAAIKGERLTGEDAGRFSQAPHSGLPEGQHSLDALIESWYKSAQWTQLGDTTRQHYRLLTEELRERFGHKAVEDLNRSTVKMLMQEKADKPNAANKRLRILRFLLDHAVEVLEWVDTNPAREVKKFAINTDGYHTWTEDEISKFYATHEEGSMADLAMTLMLCTGAARADAVQLGPDNIESVNGVPRLRYYRQKMKTRNGVLVDIPVHPELARRIERLTHNPETFLQTEAGKQRSSNGLGNHMRKWCDEAGLKQCSAHGLRKACARRLAEAGASPHEIMAVTGHKTLVEVERYTQKVQRAGMADTAFKKQNGV